jgi:hypothetical protein
MRNTVFAKATIFGYPWGEFLLTPFFFCLVFNLFAGKP